MVARMLPESVYFEPVWQPRIRILTICGLIILRAYLPASLTISEPAFGRQVCTRGLCPDVWAYHWRA